MPHVEPLSREDLTEFEPIFKLIEAAMGFVPRSLYTMGRQPALLRAFAGLVGTILGPGGSIDPELKQLIAYVASRAAGCSYCQAHTASSAHRAGVPAEKLRAAFDYGTSPLFSDRERAALMLANDAALVPNAAEERHFDALRKHFSSEEITEIVSVISLFGYLNRWNDTLATQLEDEALEFAQRTLAEGGWKLGKHA